MKINKFKYIVFVNLIIWSVAYGMDAKLKNFQPGKYVPIEGTHKDCSSQEFNFYSGGENTVMLGPHHLFKTKQGSESYQSDLPFEKNCKYESHDQIDVRNRETTLTLKSIFRCKEGVRYTLTEEALITNDRVVLDVSKVIEDENYLDETGYEYRCIWSLKKK